MMDASASDLSGTAVNGLFMVICRLRGIEPLDVRQIAALRRSQAPATPVAPPGEGLGIEDDPPLAEVLALQCALDRWFSYGQPPDIGIVQRILDLLRRAGRPELEQALLAVWRRHFPNQRADGAPERRAPRPAPPPAPAANGETPEAAASGAAEGREPEAGVSDVTDYWSVPPVILMALGGVSPTSISLVQNRGDSMVPTLLDGDVAITDTRHTTPSPDGLYALKDIFGSTVIKRLSIVSGADDRTTLVRVVSDNPRYEQRLVHLDELHIVGRILRKFGHVH